MIPVVAEGLGKSYRRRRVLDGVDLVLSPDRITVLLGPSGCGKTTLLRILAGLAAPDAGTVKFGATVVNDPRPRVPAEERGIGMVFQEPYLWPHLTVRRIIGFPLGRRRDAAPLVEAAAAAVRATAFLDRKPGELSGGERQRVSIARAIVAEPKVLLFDEPLTGLDATLRGELLAVIRDVKRKLGVAALYVTHDQEEALELADHIVVMRDGRILQEGPPAELYRAPRTAFVARFVGRSTLVSGRVDDTGRASTPLGAFYAPGVPAGPALFAVRPETVVPAEEGFPAVVETCRFRGDRHLLTVRAGDRRLLATSPAARTPGEAISLRLAAAPPAVADDRSDDERAVDERPIEVDG